MANNFNLSEAGLDAYLGKSIEEICPLKFGKIGDEHNHCAHFVGHVLSLNSNLNVGLTCAGMTYGGKKNASQGACLRVNEVFNRCDDLTEADEKGCLIYITMATNMHNGTMGQQKKKHIGIYLNGTVWHYGNTKDKVRCQSLDEFKLHYSGKTVVVFTVIPKGAVLVSA